MEIFSPHENIWLIVMIIYLSILLISYISSFRLDKYGIRTIAKVISSESVNSSDTSSGELTPSASYSHFVSIEFRTKNNELMHTEISIEERFKNKQYKSNLPIVYHQNKPSKPKIDDTLSIYQAPIALSIVLFIAAFTIFFTVLFN